MTAMLRAGTLVLLSLVLAFSLAACGAGNEGSQGSETNGESQEQENQSGGNEENANQGGETENGGEQAAEELSGEVKTAGSSTVYPVMLALSEWYREQQPNVSVTVDSVGSGGGFKQSTQGLLDFSNASRPIKEEERATAEENGINLHEVVLAYDGLTVAVSQKNDFVDDLTVDQLKQIFLAEAGNTKWSDIDPNWPDQTIKIFSPGHDSGTFDYFNEVILEEKAMREDENVMLSEDDNLLVRGISDDPYAIGYFGYAYYLANQDTLKALKINGVEPNGDTIQSGEYTPLSRPLFTYINAASLEKPQVYDFAMFVLDNAGKAAEEVGYVALPDEKYQEQKQAVQELAGK